MYACCCEVLLSAGMVLNVYWGGCGMIDVLTRGCTNTHAARSPSGAQLSSTCAAAETAYIHYSNIHPLLHAKLTPIECTLSQTATDLDPAKQNSPLLLG